MNEQFAVGIDIGGTNTVMGIVDRRGSIREYIKISTKAHDKVEDYIDAIYDALMPLFEQVKGKVVGLGVGAPNGNIYNGTIEFAPNLPWKGVIPIAKLLKEKFNLPVQITNDANAAAEGEMAFGAAKGLKNFIMITLGTGLGSGIVINGELVYGHDGFAGELGHVMIEKNGRLCGCGRHGCLEAYVSATGIVRTMKELLDEKDTDSELRTIERDKFTSKDIGEAAARGDELALEAMDSTAETLGRALANFTAFSAPEVFILFGGLARAGEVIMKPTKRYMEANMLNIWKNKVKIIRSELNESDAAILGASALAWPGDVEDESE